MRLADFDYALPSELIAQSPASPRDASRLLVVHRETQRLEHRIFRDIGEYLRAGDVLVVNDTRVIRARLRGRRAGTGGAVELLLLRPLADGSWEALVRPGRRLRTGTIIEVGVPAVEVEVAARLPDGRRILRLRSGGEMQALIAQAGEVPLPPYIHRRLDDPEQYQTVYSREEGAIAAPTAGLHFTPGLLDRLRAQGIIVAALTLHVGLGTFQPVTVDDVTAHRMQAEYYAIPPETAAAINERRGRLVAVGTTTVRTLESVEPAPGGRILPSAGWTELFIAPGHAFRATEAMVTNFHLPRTTLLMLVSAFAGRDLILRAYQEAVRERYRFYSFGDAMLIV
jgi:S-adenosylmethionine:tRNA ribosyltransferase-isomerase